MAKYITVKQLKRAGACDGQVADFQELFGRDGKLKVTVDAVTAIAHRFGLYWAADHLLSSKQRVVFSRERTKLLKGAQDKRQQQFDIINGLNLPVFEQRDLLKQAVREHFMYGYNYANGAAFAIAYNSAR